MNVQRGDVVVVDFPFSSGGSSKMRPALVVQSDVENRRVNSTVVAMITKRSHRAHVEPTQFLIDPMIPEGKQSGLHHKSAVNFINLFTVEKSLVMNRIGSLTAAQMAHADLCLKAALEL